MIAGVTLDSVSRNCGNEGRIGKEGGRGGEGKQTLFTASTEALYKSRCCMSG